MTPKKAAIARRLKKGVQNKHGIGFLEKDAKNKFQKLHGMVIGGEQANPTGPSHGMGLQMNAQSHKGKKK